MNRRKMVGLLTCGLFLEMPMSPARGIGHQERPPTAVDSNDELTLELNRIRSRIQHLLAVSAPELYRRHLHSILAMCEEGVLTSHVAGSSDKDRSELLGYLKAIASGLNQRDVQTPATYLVEGKRELSLARVSRSDGTIQLYSVRLPSRWDPHKSYPLWVQLHGRWSDLSLALVANKLAPLDKEDGPEEEAIILTPWVRGNSDYRLKYGSEPDLWEAIDDLKTFASLDPNRWYLSGHSWGGDDTWAIVLRTPDLWAATGIMAGHPAGLPDQLGLVANARNVPFYLWRGSVDPVPNRVWALNYFRDALTAVGNPPKVVVAEGVPHMYRPQDLVEMRRWLFQHVRHRPNSFSFVADTREHRGVWGIAIPVRYPDAYFNVEPRTSFRCDIDGSVIRIQTTDTKRLDVDLSPQGLDEAGPMSISINESQVFHGTSTAKPLTFSW